MDSHLRRHPRRLILLWLTLTLVFSGAATLLPVAPPFAYDWRHFFQNPQQVPAFYPPWTRWILLGLRYPTLLGLTLATFLVAVLLRARSVGSAVLALFNLPLFWVMFLGQLDGLALLGTLGLPWSLPLVFVKPQVAAFAVFARRRTLVYATLFLGLTLLLWGPWPLRLLTYHADPAAWPQDIALGWRGFPLFLLLVWKMPRDDMDWWMLAGTTVTPALIPYHLLPLMPAMARLPLLWAAGVALASWFPLLANWWGPWAWHLGWVSVFFLGWGLFLETRKGAAGSS